MKLSFEQYAAEARARGADEVVERVRAPGTRVPEHGHPFAAEAVVVAGEMWLTQVGVERHLGVGDSFSLAADEPHAERYGAQGATYWVARRKA